MKGVSAEPNSPAVSLMEGAVPMGTVGHPEEYRGGGDGVMV